MVLLPPIGFPWSTPPEPNRGKAGNVPGVAIVQTTPIICRFTAVHMAAEIKPLDYLAQLGCAVGMEVDIGTRLSTGTIGLGLIWWVRGARAEVTRPRLRLGTSSTNVHRA